MRASSRTATRAAPGKCACVCVCCPRCDDGTGRAPHVVRCHGGWPIDGFVPPDIHSDASFPTLPPSGFGFVTFATKEEAQAAIDALNETELDGRTIRVNFAQPRDPNAPRPPRRGKQACVPAFT